MNYRAVSHLVVFLLNNQAEQLNLSAIERFGKCDFYMNLSVLSEKNYSCQYMLKAVVEQWTAELENRDYMSTVLIDIS